MAALKIPSTAPELGVRATKSAPVVIATDGREQSDSALVIGRLFARSDDAMRLVTVVKEIQVVPQAQIPVPAHLDVARRAEARREMSAQTKRAWGDEVEFEVLDGDPATVVARLAHKIGATMIVCGLGRHRVTDRVFGDETALRLMRMADVPVFAAANSPVRAPRRIVVAIDFTETSLRAARVALNVSAAGATIYLAHVAPRDSSLYDWNDWGTYKQDAGNALQKVREQLQAPADMLVQNVLLQGEPATELLAFAASVKADLIATGSHGHGFVGRMLIGSVATRIVRCSTCSVLTVPHAAVLTRERVTVEPPVVVNLPNVAWSSALDDFTRRNMGRRGMLEVDDPAIGAQAQEFDYPLLGATYDPHDDRVELMFGDPLTGKRVLARGIEGVTSVDVLRDERGGDLAIRIAHGIGQTLLTFAS